MVRKASKYCKKLFSSCSKEKMNPTGRLSNYVCACSTNVIGKHQHKRKSSALCITIVVVNAKDGLPNLNNQCTEWTSRFGRSLVEGLLGMMGPTDYLSLNVRLDIYIYKREIQNLCVHNQISCKFVISYFFTLYYI